MGCGAGAGDGAASFSYSGAASKLFIPALAPSSQPLTYFFLYCKEAQNIYFA
jgi:hypothetical protein